MKWRGVFTMKLLSLALLRYDFVLISIANDRIVKLVKCAVPDGQYEGN